LHTRGRELGLGLGFGAQISWSDVRSCAPLLFALCLKHGLFQQTRAMTLLQSLFRRLPKSPPEATTDIAVGRQQREAEQKFPLWRIMRLPLHLSIARPRMVIRLSSPRRLFAKEVLEMEI